MERRPKDILTREEIAALTRPSSWRGAAEVVTTWAITAGALALAAAAPHVLTALLAVVLLGGRQLAMAVLMHEASHRSLFRSRWANDLVGVWLAGGPIWADPHRYRDHHLRHHTRTGTEDDPDLGLVKPFPTSRRSMWRKVARDLTGIAGLRRLAAVALMDLGLLTYTASVDAKWVGRSGRSVWHIAGLGLRRAAPVLLTNATLLSTLWLLGHAWVYLLWIAAWLTTYSLFLRLRSIAEHACTTPGDDMWTNTRTTRANPVARLLVAPHHVNYHLEHHLLMTVPCYRLAALHRLLDERGALEGTHQAGGYVEVLRLATAG